VKGGVLAIKTCGRKARQFRSLEYSKSHKKGGDAHKRKGEAADERDINRKGASFGTSSAKAVSHVLGQAVKGLSKTVKARGDEQAAERETQTPQIDPRWRNVQGKKQLGDQGGAFRPRAQSEEEKKSHNGNEKKGEGGGSRPCLGIQNRREVDGLDPVVLKEG